MLTAVFGASGKTFAMRRLVLFGFNPTRLAALVLVLFGLSPAGAAADRWTRPVTPLAGADISYGSIACPTAAFCVAVLQRPDATRAYAVDYRGGHWGRPVVIESGDQLGPDVRVACATSRFCEAVDINGFAVRFNGASWSHMRLVPGLAATDVRGIACPAVGRCVAVAHDGSAAALAAGHWEHAVQLGPLSTSELDAVACASARDCTAVGPGPNGGGLAYPFDGHRWGAAVAFATVGNPFALSCPAVGFCVAADDAGGTEMLRGGAWRPPARAGQGHSAVACSSRTFCVTDDGNGYREFNGLVWSSRLPLPTRAGLQAVACPTRRFCAAVSGGRLITLR